MAKRPSSSPSLDRNCRVAVIHGEDDMLRSLHAENLRKTLEEAHGEVDVIGFDGATTQAADVLDECRSFGLIARYKLVIADNADQLVKEDNRPLFERYVQSLIDAAEHEGGLNAGPGVGATLVLRSRTWRSGKLDKLIEKVGVIVECKPPTTAKAAEWAMARAAKRHTATLERDAAELLVDRVGAELGKIESELGKLAAAAPDPKSPVITRALVADLVGSSREEDPWIIQSRFLAPTPTPAIPAASRSDRARQAMAAKASRNIRAVRDSIDVSRNPVQPVIYSVIDLARKIHGCSAASRAGINPREIFSALKLWGPSGEAIMERGRAIPPPAARALFRDCVEADARLKTGRGEGDLTLERLAIRFAMLD